MERLSLSHRILATAFLLALPACAYADTYQVVPLYTSKYDQVLGFVSTGVVLISHNDLGTYQTIDLFNGQYTTWLTKPALEAPVGSCPGIPVGFENSNAMGWYACDNGYIGFGSRYNPNGEPGGIYTGTIGDLTLVAGGTYDGGGIDPQGDFVWTDGRDDIDEAVVDLTTLASTPEPGSLLLVATGGLAAAGLLRRRLGVWRPAT
jgi:hypothetical protein